jgi:hypothetical protein
MARFEAGFAAVRRHAPFREAAFLCANRVSRHAKRLQSGGQGQRLNTWRSGFFPIFSITWGIRKGGLRAKPISQSVKFDEKPTQVFRKIYIVSNKM